MAGYTVSSCLSHVILAITLLLSLYIAAGCNLPAGAQPLMSRSGGRVGERMSHTGCWTHRPLLETDC